jgi:hypothetical protein
MALALSQTRFLLISSLLIEHNSICQAFHVVEGTLLPLTATSASVIRYMVVAVGPS